MLMAAIALLISGGLSAQNATQTRTESQNRSGETIQTQTQGQYQNYGQMTSEQKQIKNQEKKALKKQEKELKKQQKEMKKQETAQNRNQNMTQEKTAAKNKGAGSTAPMKNATKVSKGPGPGKK
jgi:membrane protein involved in colicin uptake